MTLEMKDFDEGEEEKTIQVSTTAMNVEVECEPTVVQIKGFVNSTYPTIMLIDSRSTHNMISSSFA